MPIDPGDNTNAAAFHTGQLTHERLYGFETSEPYDAAALANKEVTLTSKLGNNKYTFELHPGTLNLRRVHATLKKVNGEPVQGGETTYSLVNNNGLVKVKLGRDMTE